MSAYIKVNENKKMLKTDDGDQVKMNHNFWCYQISEIPFFVSITNGTVFK